jgi:transposase
MLLDLLSTLKDRDLQIDQLKHQLSLLQRHRFGRRSEQLNTDQLLLAFAELEKEGLLEAPEEKQPVTKPKEPKKGHGRKPLPEELPRERFENPLPEKELPCPQCGTKREPIGEEITEQLEYVPATFHVKQYVRIKYACKQCEGEVVISEMPPMPIDKGMPGPGLLSHILVSKYADHLPLNRQEEMLRRQGIDLRRSTLCDWVGRCAELFQPVYERMKDEVLRSSLASFRFAPIHRLRSTSTTRPQLRRPSVQSCYIGR